MRNRFRYWLCSMAATLAILFLAMGMAAAQSVDGEQLRQLQEVIKNQQELIREQARKLEEQSEQNSKQWELLQSLQGQVNRMAEDAKKAKETAGETQAVAKKETPPAEEKIITSGQEKIKLAISGHVNRMVNIADDGESTKTYHLDNDNSSSRVRFVGTGEMNPKWTLGAQLEVELESNSSTDVSQSNQDTGTANFKDRKIEAWFDSKRFGRLTIGKGSTASDGTAEVDLSGTDLLIYSSVADTGGGLLFRDKDDGSLTDIRVKDVFDNFDGLGRKDRVRYDTPAFYGFTLSGSAIEDDQWDAALTWSGEGYGVRAAGAFGLANPASDDVDMRYDGSISVLHLGTGLNLTAAAGLDDRDMRDDSNFWYIKGGWQKDFFTFGTTAFALDYQQTSDLNQDGDKGDSFGLGAVQNVSKYGLQFYSGYRRYDLDGDNVNTDAINVVSIGTRLKF